MRKLAEGTRLGGRYTLRKPVGHGGMATVWLARDARSDGDVALKVLNADLAADDRQRKRFHDEWRIGSRLMHAHIVRVFEYHDDEDGPYYGQQYVDGESLAAVAGQPLDQLMRPLGLVADALRYAHGKGVVHGDVTAANVLLDPNGAPVLIDFGIATDAAGGAAAGGGTPAALSPQRRAGAAPVAADDLYAFGVLLHELLYGAPPGAARPAQTMSGETLPAAVGALLDDLLAEQPGKRPSAEATAARLCDAGFPAGAAVLPRRARPAAAAEAVEVRSRRPERPAPAAVTAPPMAEPGSGIPAGVVAGGLVILLLALLAVLFVLPGGNDADRAPPAETMTAEPAEDATGQPAAEESPAAVDEAAGPASQPDAVAGLPEDETDAAFSENVQSRGGDRASRIKAATDEALGDLLSRLERLRYRGIERWGGQEYLDALNRYQAGDDAYLNRNYEAAGEHYRATIGMLDPFFDRIDTVFRETLAAAREAFEARDHREALRLYDLAATITPGNAEAERGLARARTLEDVLRLMERGREFEKNLEFDAARQAYSNVLELDGRWEPAEAALTRVRAALEQLSFEQRMTEGFDALAGGNLESARAAFEAAKAMRPDSSQPVDGLLQVDQAQRLATIRELQATAGVQVADERWEAAVDTYEEALSVDPDLQFAQQGLQQARQRAALHARLQGYIDNPDSLSAPQTMQAATRLLLDLSRIDPTGPRLADQKEALSRLLKRAATPLPVTLVSDNATEVSIFRVGQLGSFDRRQVELRPGSYVAMGSRPGYRDVRLEFRVAPELDMQPVVVKCEERI